MMRYLVDTHVVLWWLTDDDTLSLEIKELLDNELAVYVSAATFWEVAIKQALGKIEKPTDLADRIRDADFLELSISVDHAIAAAELPMIHRDPFDRVLVAQAQCEHLTLITRDHNIKRYDVEIMPA